MRTSDEILETYNSILNSKGKDKSKLLGVLEQARHHNIPNSYNLAIRVSALEGGDITDILGAVSDRVALVNRHIIDAQNAMKEIYNMAKEKGYKEIIEIFEKTYTIGHSGQ